MLLDLTGRVAIVTGAGRGIGREIARTFAREGVKVVAPDFRQDLLDDLAAEWKSEGWECLPILADLRRKADAQAVAAAAEKAYGRIDILVNNAGVASGAKVEDLAEEVWDNNFDTNIKGVMLMCQAVIPTMKRQKSGRIINAASFAAIIPSIGGAAYAASSPASSAPGRSPSTPTRPAWSPPK
jgi:3-oxoacyl-[acyl-carrier protein] reductase